MTNLKASSGQIDQSGDFNFTGALKKDGVDIATDAKLITSANVTVSGIKNLVVPMVTGQSFSVTGFYAGTTVGGGDFIYDASRDKADHNGGTVIAPEAITAWDGSAANIATLLDWTGTGAGCFIRESSSTALASQFGATQDNVDAATKAIQKSISESNSLEIDGYYKVNDRIDIFNKVGFKIFSKSKAFGLEQTVDMPVIYVYGSESSGFELSSLTIDGGGLGQENIGLIAIEECIGFLIADNEVRNGGYAVNGVTVSQSGAAGVIESNHVYNFGKAGIYSATDADFVVIENNIVHDITNNQYTSPFDVPGIQVIGGLNSKIKQNKVYNCSGDGIFGMTGQNYLTNSDAPYNIEVSSNTCFSNGGTGVRIIQGVTNGSLLAKDTRASINNNYCYDNDDNGIFFDGRDSADISSNWCYSNGTGTGGIGIYVRSASAVNIVSNHCFDNAYSGIQVNACVGLSIALNKCYAKYGTQVRGITFSGAACDNVRMIANDCVSVVQFVAPTNLYAIYNTGISDYIDIPAINTFPAASEALRGRVFIDAGGTGVRDELSACMKDINGDYEWRVISS